MKRSNQVFVLNEHDRIHFTWGECGNHYFHKDTYYKDVRQNNRLFVVRNVGTQEGELQVEGQAPITLSSQQLYLIPEKKLLQMFFPQGMTITSFHFSVTNILYQDIFSSCSQAIQLKDDRFRESILEFIKDLNFKEELTFFTEMQLRLRVKGLCCQLAEEVDLPSPIHDKLLIEFQPLFDDLQKTPAVQIKASDAAQACGMPLSTFSKAFKKISGKSIKQFLTEASLRSCLQSIIYTELRIKEIAFLNGFENEFYFSRFIKKHTGRSPLHVRKQHKEII